MAFASHVLVVEDDPLVAEVLQTTLEELYRVRCAHTVSEALRFLRTGHFNVVLVDCILPDGRGELVADFAEINGTPVIEMSGYQADMFGPNGRRRPHLQKPFGTVLLLSTIDGVLAEQRAAPALLRPP
jgi:DNA-binding response OmpR family regulator